MLLKKKQTTSYEKIEPKDILAKAINSKTNNHSIAKKTIEYFTQILAVVSANASAGLLLNSIYILGGVCQKLNKAGLFNTKLFTKYYLLPGRKSCQDVLAECEIKMVTTTVPAFQGLKELMKIKSSFKLFAQLDKKIDSDSHCSENSNMRKMQSNL